MRFIVIGAAIPRGRKGNAMKNRKLVFGIILLAITAVMGCSKKEEGTATAKLQFSNANAIAMDWKSRLKALVFPNAYAAAMSSPTTFKLKLISAYLAQDVDPVTQNNIGESSMFYVNPQCGEDNMRCNVSPGIAEDGQPYTDIITNFFDFGQGSTAVNEALNAQNRAIKPGIYKYVRLDFCKGGTNGVPNAGWAGGNVAVETQFSTGMCGVTSAVMDPPLEVKEGDNVTIWLGYDYSYSIQTGADAQGWDCVGSGGTKTCFSIPDFIPAVLR